MNYATHEQQLIRRDLLLILANDAQRRCSEVLMLRVLEDRGYVLSQDDVRTTAAWLAKIGLVRVDQIVDIQIFNLLDRARKIVRGREVVDGIAAIELPTA
jgi:hypothetical protein